MVQKNNTMRWIDNDVMGGMSVDDDECGERCDMRDRCGDEGEAQDSREMRKLRVRHWNMKNIFVLLI